MILHLIAVACTVLLLTRPLGAASSYAGEFLALGAGARALSLGSAYVAIADDATAGYWNAAALATLKGRQIHLTHGQRFAGLVRHDYLALARPGKRIHGLALSLMRTGVDDQKETILQDPGGAMGPHNRPLVSSTFSSSDYALYLSGGQRFSERVSAGASLKLIYRTIGNFSSAYGLGLDLGLLYRLRREITVAVSIRDVTTTPVSWDPGSTDRIQPSFLAGIAYSRPFLGGRTIFSLATRRGGDAEDQSGAKPINAGLEYWYEHVALRVGMEESSPAYGLGLILRRRFELDLARFDHYELGHTYHFSASVQF
jgi:hypothetical protein